MIRHFGIQKFSGRGPQENLPRNVYTSPLFLKTKSTVCAKKTQHGRCCLFPFQYHGKLYNSCTTVGYGNTLWCGTTKYVTYARSTWDECPKGKQHFLKVRNIRNHHYYNILFFILQFNKDLVIEKLR